MRLAFPSSHNFHELQYSAQQDLGPLVTTGRALMRSNPYLHEPKKGRIATDLGQQPVVIATANMLQCMPPPIVQALPCFAPRRYRESIRSSLRLWLAGSQAAPCTGGAVDAPTDARVVSLCWAAMPTHEIVTALQAFALEQGVAAPDWKGLAEKLGLHVALDAEVAIAANHEDARQAGRDCGSSGTRRRPALTASPDGAWRSE